MRLDRIINLTAEDMSKLGYECETLMCHICGKPETTRHSKHGKVKRLAKDHCHKTGEIRGDLCQRCNTALGLMDDDVDRLYNAIAYLSLSH